MIADIKKSTEEKMKKTFEALKNDLGKVRTGDVIRLDAVAGTLAALVDEATWGAREQAVLSAEQAEVNAHGLGRELFGGMRRNVLTAEEGAVTWL